jgi:glycosyltransferase involved in cell wall biosynthesis
MTVHAPIRTDDAKDKARDKAQDKAGDKAGDRAGDKVVVALNALINPDNAGGSESSALSIVANFRDADPDDVELLVTAFPQYAEKIAAIRGDASKVIAWPWQEFTTIASEPRAEWARKLRARLGKGLAGRLFDDLSRAVNRRAFLKKMPSRRDIDGLLDRHGVDVAHFTYPVKWPTRRPYIFEPHDVQQCHFPEFFPADVLHWRHRTYTDGIRNSAFVVCGTWWTKRDIMRNFGVPASQVAVIPRSSTMARAEVPPAEVEILAAEAKLPERYMYYPAMTFPHKNHLRLLEAMALLRDRHDLNPTLVCTGRPYKPFHPELVQAAKRLGLEKRVRFLGKVSEELLTVCYKRAAFVIFPSLLEGHSQSLLESLYHGKPIIAAKQSSVPETVGQAGAFFDALDVESIAEALRRPWIDDAYLAELAARTEGSFERYSWDRALMTLRACYRKAAGRSLSIEEQAALDRALLEHNPDDPTGPHPE